MGQILDPLWPYGLKDLHFQSVVQFAAQQDHTPPPSTMALPQLICNVSPRSQTDPDAI